MSDESPTRDELLAENRRLRKALERRRAQAPAAGLTEASLFREMFRLSPIGLALTRLADGRFVDVNPELCRLTGYKREELLGRPSVERGLWGGTRKRRKAMTERLSAEGVVRDYELILVPREGPPVDLLGSFRVVTVDDEEMVLSMFTDISARRQAEHSQRQAREAADRARQEAEEIAQFRSSVVANMTHEVRTPLTVILGFTSILREGVDRSHRRFVDLIERSGRRLLMTLDSVLDLAQLESGTLDVNVRAHNILDLVDSVASPARSMAEKKGLDFKMELPGQLLYADVDCELLSRVLSQILDNAVKFTDEGSITLRVRSESGKVLVEIEDTGIGIVQSFLPELFDTFSQESSGIERDYQGAGMGLAVAARLMEHFEGEIRVESEKGVGSTFTAVLPEVKAVPIVQKNQVQAA